MLKLKKSVAVRKIGDDYMLVPVGKSTKEYKGLFAITEVAALIIYKLKVGCEMQDLVECVTAEFEVDEKTALKDIEIFTKQLSELDLI